MGKKAAKGGGSKPKIFLSSTYKGDFRAKNKAESENIFLLHNER